MFVRLPRKYVSEILGSWRQTAPHTALHKTEQISSCIPQATKLTLNLLTTTIVAPTSNASKWQMGFNSAFKGLSDMLFYDVQSHKVSECHRKPQ